MKNLLKSFFENYILRYIHLYDPGYFSLIYACKTLIAVFLSIAINVFLFGPAIVVWAGLIPIYIYFLNVLMGDKNSKLKYLFVFIFLSILAVFIFSIVANFGVWLFLPVVLVAFIAGISAAYSLDLQKVLNMVLINGLVACIYVNSGTEIYLSDEILTIIIGGLIGIMMLFFSVGKYGKFTKKNFPTLLFDLVLMVENIAKSNDYAKIRNQTLTQIENIKYILNSKAGKIKDPHIIKNTKRTLFYLYRVEEIYHSINSIHHYFSSKKINPKFYLIQREIIHNLKELSKMFEAHRPSFSKKEFEALNQADINKVFLSSVRIIYNKIESFSRGGQDENYLATPAPQKNFRDVLKVLKYRDPTFRYSIKYALVLGVTVFIARYLEIDHGIWMAMGAMAIVRPNLGGIKDLGKDYFIGTFVGLFVGILFAILFANTFIFYVLFALATFLFIYFKVYPYALWSGVMMVAFVMMFAMLREDFLGLMLGRFLNVLVGFGVVFVAFWFLWPKYSSDDIIPNIKESVSFLEKLTNMLIDFLQNSSTKKRQILNTQGEFFNHHTILNSSINEAKKEAKSHSEEYINNALKASKYIDFINQDTNKLYEYLGGLSKEELKENKEIFENDIRLISTRYEMLAKLIDGLPYYFKEEKDGRFLCNDEKFSIIIDDVFRLQNKLYLNIVSNLKRS